MSSLFRNLSAVDRQSRSAAAGICFAGMLACEAAGAAQYYVTPNAELAAEEHTNIGMDPNVSKKLDESYFATLGAVIGIVTPRSQTTLKPQLSRPYYPGQEGGTGTTEGKLDLNSYYRSLRSTVSVTGRAERRDEVRGELPNAQVDELNPKAPNPNLPTTPETGRVQVGAKRDMFFISPGYSFELNPLLALDASAMYQTINYSTNSSVRANDFVDFSFYKGAVALRRTTSPRADVSIGPYFARYESSGGNSTHTDGTGGVVSFQYKWSQTQYWNLNAFVERQDYGKQPAGLDDAATAYGADFTMAFRQQVSNVFVNLGRTVTPSGNGGVYYSDQLQVQYGRDLSQRLGLVAAVRYLNDSSVVDLPNTNDRKYAQADLDFRYQLTQTLYVRAGYEYTWQEYRVANNPAHDHRIALGIGYQGLARR